MNIKQPMHNIVRLMTAFLFLFLSSCGFQQSECDYDINKFKAQVQDIQRYTINDYKKHKLADTIEYYHVLLKFDVSTLASETQSLGLLKNKHISASYITRNNIKKDIIYTGLVSEIKSGKCNPLIISFDQKLE